MKKLTILLSILMIIIPSINGLNVKASGFNNKSETIKLAPGDYNTYYKWENKGKTGKIFREQFQYAIGDSWGYSSSITVNKTITFSTTITLNGKIANLQEGSSYSIGLSHNLYADPTRPSKAGVFVDLEEYEEEYVLVKNGVVQKGNHGTRKVYKVIPGTVTLKTIYK